jgi:flagellar biosynthetic protein FliO
MIQHPVFVALLTGASARPEAGGPDMTRYVLVCFLLLGLIGGAAWLFKRVVASSVRARASKRSLQVVDLLPLGGKQRLCVVRCYDRTFALGLGDKEIALIAELDAVAAPVKASAPFSALLRREQERESDEQLVPPEGKKRGLFAAGGLFA